MTKAMLLVLVGLSASPVHAQYRNFEVQPDGTGGLIGTYGEKNFQIDPRNGGSGQIGGRRPGIVRERPSSTPGNVGATQRNCKVDGNGNALCR